MRLLLVTNDFPPKIGGIQSYLGELWRRLPPEQVAVSTRDYPGATAWDAQQAFPVQRTGSRWPLLPVPGAAHRLRAAAEAAHADLVVADPLFQVGLVAARAGRPYAVVVHGAEVTLPAAVPGLRSAGRRALRGAAAVVAAGEWPARAAARLAGRPLPGIVVPPGVDAERFRPLDPEARAGARARFGLPVDAPIVLGVSRLVPRKGFDVLIEAVAGLDPAVVLAIAGSGRDRARLEGRARRAGIADRVRLLGRVSDAQLQALYGCADVFSMLCRERWGGLEAEGFGIVFLEAAACAVPSVAGRSGGSHEAVVDGATGLVVAPRDVGAARDALRALLADPGRRAAMGAAARARAETELSYDRLARRLDPLLAGDLSTLKPIGALP